MSTEPAPVPGEVPLVPEPGSVDELEDQGWRAYVQGEYPRSEEYFRKALDKNSRSIEGNYGLGLLLKSKGQIPEARRHFETVIEEVKGMASEGSGGRATMLRHLAETHLNNISPEDWQAPDE